MSLALKFGDINDPKSLQGIIYLNAVTGYSREYGGKVTEHPIELGAFISDHFIAQNPKIKLSGVLSHIDFTNAPNVVKDIDGIEFINKYEKMPEAVSVNDIGSSLSRFLPGVVTQFLGAVPPQVTMDSTTREEFNGPVENFMKDLINGVSYDEEKQRYFNKMTTASLFEIQGEAFPVFIVDNLVVTSFSIKEDADSGEGMYFDMSLEKVTFVTLEKTEAPKPETKDAKKTAPTENKGTQKPTTTTNGEKVEPKGGGNINARGALNNVMTGVP